MKVKKLNYAALALLLIVLVALLCDFVFDGHRPRPAMLAELAFRGDYRIAEGPWLPIEEGKHISAMDGDVTLRGNFYYISPEGEPEDVVGQDRHINLYINHLQVSFYVDGEYIYSMDVENPTGGKYSCGQGVMKIINPAQEDQTLELVLHNPHKMGNSRAVDDLLHRSDFFVAEDEILGKQESLRLVLSFSVLLVAVAVLGVAVTSLILKLQHYVSLTLVGLICLCGGVRGILDTVRTLSWVNMFFGTTAEWICDVLYLLFVLCLCVRCLREPQQKVGRGCIGAYCVMAVILSGISLLMDVSLYDLMPWGLLAQAVICITVILLSVTGRGAKSRNQRRVLICGLSILLAAQIDALGIAAGWWQGWICSKVAFGCNLLIGLVLALVLIPANFRAAQRAKEMESQLQEQRVAIMLSQIQPHFLYNSLTTTMSLCDTDPKLAKHAIADFAKYLRGNMNALTNKSPVPFSRELRHMEAYTRLEKMRFEERLQVNYEIGTDDFLLPALSVQPLVENAIKHGLTEKAQGGTVTVRTFETGEDYCVEVRDDGIGFDTAILSDAASANIGIRNVRNRLDAMVGGRLEIQSVPGEGTVATIRIPKGEANV